MKIYNYFSTWEELNLFFRQEFQGEGQFCKTNREEPFLQEHPILLHLHTQEVKEYPEQSLGDIPSNRHSLPKIQLMAQWKQGKARQSESHSLGSENLTVAEDVAEWKFGSHRVQIQAMNSGEAYIFWEREERENGGKEILFQGVIKHRKRNPILRSFQSILQKFRNQ